MIYLDSAALVKMIRPEAATPALRDWLNARPDAMLMSSVLAEVEVTRALRRVAPEALPAIPHALARLYRVEIGPSIRAAAGLIGNAAVRTLDAIHLATAQSVGVELEALVSYDQRLLRAGDELGLPTASPGA